MDSYKFHQNEKENEELINLQIELEKEKEERARLEVILKAEKLKIQNLTNELRKSKEETVSEKEQVQNSTTLQSGNKICNKCGKVNVPVAIFCASCGTSYRFSSNTLFSKKCHFLA